MEADHYLNIYRNHADRYDAMVRKEDYQGNLLPAIAGIAPLVGRRVIEMGAGTGRLTRLLAPHVAAITACDFTRAMLVEAERSLREMGADNASVAVAENSRMPFQSGIADLVITGWSLGHLQNWHQRGWPAMVDRVLDEMRRMLRPAGTLLIIETLGAGAESPEPPHEGLAAYYAHLENEHGFERRWIRTDYRFDSLQESVEMMRFFFGDEMADRASRNEWVIVPECTGLWFRRAAT